MTTLKTEITDYEDFTNSPDGEDNYIPPIFGDSQIQDHSAAFADARLSHARLARAKMHFDGAKALFKGLIFGTTGVALVYIAQSITTL